MNKLTLFGCVVGFDLSRTIDNVGSLYGDNAVRAFG